MTFLLQVYFRTLTYTEMCLNPHREGKRNLHLYLQHQKHHTVLQNSISMLKKKRRTKTLQGYNTKFMHKVTIIGHLLKVTQRTGAEVDNTIK